MPTNYPAGYTHWSGSADPSFWDVPSWRDMPIEWGGGGGGDGGYIAPPPPAPEPEPVVTPPAPEPPKAAQHWPIAETAQPAYSYYEPTSQDEMLRLAQESAQLYAQPIYQEMERKLEQSLADAAAQEARIQGTYQGTEQALSRRETEQGRRDLESAIARGAGRSGVVPHMARQRGDYFSELLAAERAKKDAEMYAIANQLSMTQRQVPQQRLELADQVGRLTNQELQRLREAEFEKAKVHDLDQFQRMLNMYDRTMMTPMEQLQMYIALAQLAGTFPDAAPSVIGTFNQPSQGMPWDPAWYDPATYAV